MPYIPTLAAVLAVIGILVVFKRNVDKLKEHPELVEKYQTKLFIGVAISEALPIVLIIYGFTTMDTVASMDELYVPAVLIIAMMIYSIIFIFTQTGMDVKDHETKTIMRMFGLIGVVLVNAIPIVSLVMLFMMSP